MNEERCVCCGEIIPEGRQVCLLCERKVRNAVHKRWCDGNPIVYRYREYMTIVHYSERDKCYYGKLIGIGDLVLWDCETLDGAEKEFHDAVDDYLAFCEEVDKEPEVVKNENSV